MRHLRTLMPVLLSMLLLGLCIAAAAISRHRTFRWGFSTLHNRYTFLIDHQRLFIRASPPPRKEDAEAWELLKRLRNDDVEWMATWFHFMNSDMHDAMWGPNLMPEFKPSSPAWKLSTLSTVSDEPFLRGLDSPKKFVAAHVLLVYRHNRAMTPWNQDKEPLVIDFKALQFHLRTALQPPQLSTGIRNVPIPDRDITLTAGQLPTIRNMWHDALDRTIVSISVWWISAGTIVVVAMQCIGVLRRIKRLRPGQCVHCGYDLRASTGVCPECGAPIPKNASTPSTV